METYLRFDMVNFKNVVDLDSSKKDDTSSYLGLDYSLGFISEFKDTNATLYLKLERNGPFDYDAPLFVHNTLMTSDGVTEPYRNDELLPQLEEFWLDFPLFSNFRFKCGLYTYEVGNGFSLNGSYENYGFTFYHPKENVTWRLYYCRPDLVYKNPLGPHLSQEEVHQIGYNHNAANFFAGDIKFDNQNGWFNSYIGVLVDYTSSNKRDNIFSAPIKREILGTAGLAWNINRERLSFTFEAAHNFGKAETASPEYEDIYHTGYLFFVDIDYNLDVITPSLQLLVCSGNKVTPQMAEQGLDRLISGRNRAFSCYSPFNLNLGDSISAANVDSRPIVAMGTGYGINYGLPRPGTFSASDFDNLIMPSLSFNFKPTDRLCLSLCGYYLWCFERPVGTLNGQGKYFSRDLGYEVDLFIDYQLNPNILVSFLGGSFFPGRYYKAQRDDNTGSLFSPFVRGDGKADSAYQIELAIEFKF
ncbi:MAG: alginate export family protein [Candidatus Omnitrophica bacterium]|nr:alginate export family protein [Candidatus Omnitrophota bacterium]